MHRVRHWSWGKGRNGVSIPSPHIPSLHLQRVYQPGRPSKPIPLLRFLFVCFCNLILNMWIRKYLEPRKLTRALLLSSYMLIIMNCQFKQSLTRARQSWLRPLKVEGLGYHTKQATKARQMAKQVVEDRDDNFQLWLWDQLHNWRLFLAPSTFLLSFYFSLLMF